MFAHKNTARIIERYFLFAFKLLNSNLFSLFLLNLRKGDG